MSPGLGRAERFVLEELERQAGKEGRPVWMTVLVLANLYASHLGRTQVTRGLIETIRRACFTLCDEKELVALKCVWIDVKNDDGTPRKSGETRGQLAATLARFEYDDDEGVIVSSRSATPPRPSASLEAAR